MFNPKRLTLARKRRKFTGKELAELSGLSQVTITRLEKGNNEPDLKTLEALIKVLNFPKEFFFGDDIDELNENAASFRSLTSITAKEREAALSAGALSYLFADWIAEKFNLPKADIIDLSSEPDPACAARALREYWGLGEKPISNMIKLLESKGVRVFSLCEETKNVDAFSCWRNDTPYVFLNTLKSAERSRFDAAHELGHLILHKHGGPQGKEAEIEANKFASFFLMPYADVISHLPFVTSLDQLINYKRRWGVSVAALAYHLHKMEALTAWQYRTFIVQIGSRGYRRKEPDEMKREESILWKKVLGELWNNRITKTDIATNLNLPPDEIENLLFGLTSDPTALTPPAKSCAMPPDLKVL